MRISLLHVISLKGAVERVIPTTRTRKEMSVSLAIWDRQYNQYQASHTMKHVKTHVRRDWFLRQTERLAHREDCKATSAGNVSTKRPQ